jgi:hypothetical protein
LFGSGSAALHDSLNVPLEHDPEKWKPVSRLREALDGLFT